MDTASPWRLHKDTQQPMDRASPWSLQEQHQYRETSAGQLKPWPKVSEDTSPRQAEAVPLFAVRENDSDLIVGNYLEGCPSLKREKAF